MSKVTTFLNRIFTLVFVLLSWPRLAVTRIFPSYQQTQRPSTAKVFALSDAAWAELRAGGDFMNQDKGASKSSDSQQEPSKNDSNKSAKDKKEPKSAECDKAGPNTGDDNKGTSPSDDKKSDNKKSDDKRKDPSKTSECDPGAGGGDGDIGGTGG